MKQLFVMLMILLATDPSEIAMHNRLKGKARQAYENKDYKTAARNYSQLYDTLGMTDPAIGLNLAHSYYAMGDTANARLKYQAVAASDNPKLKSIAYQQLGVMTKKPETLNESLNYLKSALKADPSNEAARYNYEVVKKQIEDQKNNQDQNKNDQNQQNQDQQQDKDQNKQDQNKQDQDQNKEGGDQDKQGDQNKDEQNKDQQNKDQKDQKDQGKEGDQQKKEDQQKGDQKDKKGEKDQQQDQQPQQGDKSKEDQNQKDQQSPNLSTKQKLEQMNISEEKAKMILDAMKNNEIQYIQQQQRKATKSQDSSKPDW